MPASPTPEVGLGVTNLNSSYSYAIADEGVVRTINGLMGLFGRL